MSSKKKTLPFSLSCGCRDSKSVSVSVSETLEKPKNLKLEVDLRPSISSGVTLSSSWEEKEECSFSGEALSGESTSSFSGLLRQLNELEQSVLAWPNKIPGSEGPVRRCHSRSRSEGGRIGESVAVVKESDDPLADFRRSMLQMIVEKEIVGVEELRELLERFLSLNSPQHHQVIIRAFSEIWNQMFPSYQNTPQFSPNLRR